MYEKRKKTQSRDTQSLAELVVPVEGVIQEDERSFRAPMKVTAVRAYAKCPDLYTYPLCPRCEKPMEREYQAFCCHCGQALSWKGFYKAVIVFSYPHNSKNEE